MKINELLSRLLHYDTPKQLRGEIPLLKDGTIEYPGHMAFTSKGGEYFHGCRVAVFRTITELNEFFVPGNAGHLKLVADIQLTPQGILIVYTNKLSAEDMEDVEEFNREMHSYFADKKAKRELAKAEQNEAKQKQAALDKADLELGRKYRARVKEIKSSSIGKERERLLKEVDGGLLLENNQSTERSPADTKGEL